MSQGQGHDPLLAALGALGREEQRDDSDPWVDLLTGRSSAPPAPPGSSDPEEHAALAALFTAPIPDHEVEALTERARAAWAPAASSVVPLRRRPRFWTALAGSLALAATILLWIRIDASASVAYSVEVRSTSVSPDRAPAASNVAHRYRPDSTLDVVIAPERAVTQPVALRILARDASGRERLLSPPVARNPEGVLSLRGRLDAILSLAPGLWRLHFIVTPADAAPSDAAEAAALPVAAHLQIEVLPSD